MTDGSDILYQLLFGRGRINYLNPATTTVASMSEIFLYSLYNDTHDKNMLPANNF